MTCLGIVLPAENDIPLAAFLATLLVATTLGLVAAVTNLLGLPTAAGVATIATLLLTLTAHVICRIKAHDAQNRHEGAVFRPSPSSRPDRELLHQHSHRMAAPG